MNTKFKRLWMSLDSEGKRQLAKKMQTSVPYLSQIAHQHRRPGAKIIMAIEKATKGKIKPTDIRKAA